MVKKNLRIALIGLLYKTPLNATIAIILQMDMDPENLLQTMLY
jgi:hypothetical protein